MAVTLRSKTSVSYLGARPEDWKEACRALLGDRKYQEVEDAVRKKCVARNRAENDRNDALSLGYGSATHRD